MLFAWYNSIQEISLSLLFTDALYHGKVTKNREITYFRFHYGRILCNTTFIALSKQTQAGYDQNK